MKWDQLAVEYTRKTCPPPPGGRCGKNWCLNCIDG
jgi:hypothetical protein